jgi:hypothetical protein
VLTGWEAAAGCVLPDELCVPLDAVLTGCDAGAELRTGDEEPLL